MPSSQVVLEMNAETAKLETAFAKLNEKVRDLQGQLKEAGGAGKKSGDELGGIGRVLVDKLNIGKNVANELGTSLGALTTKFVGVGAAIKLILDGYEEMNRKGKEAADRIGGQLDQRAMVGNLTPSKAEAKMMGEWIEDMRKKGASAEVAGKTINALFQSGMAADRDAYADLTKRGLDSSVFIPHVRAEADVFKRNTRDMLNLLLKSGMKPKEGMRAFDAGQLAEALSSSAAGAANLGASPEEHMAAVQAMSAQLGTPQQGGQALKLMEADFTRRLPFMRLSGKWAEMSKWDVMRNMREAMADRQNVFFDVGDKGHRGRQIRTVEEFFGGMVAELGQAGMDKSREEYGIREKFLRAPWKPVDMAAMDPYVAAAQKRREREASKAVSQEKIFGQISSTADEVLEERIRDKGVLGTVVGKAERWLYQKAGTDSMYLGARGWTTKAGREQVELLRGNLFRSTGELDTDTLAAIGLNLGTDHLAQDAAFISQQKSWSRSRRARQAAESVGEAISVAQTGGTGVGNPEFLRVMTEIRDELRSQSQKLEQMEKSTAETAENGRGRNPTLVHPQGDENR